jgi:SAM-dependent methyltransferase
MRKAISVLLGAVLLALVTPALQAQAQKAQKDFVPQVGQAGKDVIWVPTPDAVVKRMLEMAKVGPKDFVVDLGSGDGRTVIAAARDFNARALGVEFNSNMVELSRKSASQAGVLKRVEFRKADIFATDFSQATVVTMYLLPELNLRLRPRLLDLKPGTRLVSHSFKMGEWQPDQSEDVEGHGVHLWIVPAKVGGNWTLEQPEGALLLSLTQQFQTFRGSAKSPGAVFDLRTGKLYGTQIYFMLVASDGSRTEYMGSVSGNTMQGTRKASGRAEAKWSATKP